MKPFYFPQYGDEWLAMRRGRPTASEFKRIITPAKCEFASGALTYACELIADEHDPNYGTVEEYVSAAMRNGTIMEPQARRWFEFEAGEPVVQVGFCLSDDEQIGCSPDSLVGETSVLELKCPQPATHVRWLLEKTLPADHKAQSHGHMIVTGRELCWFMSYCPGFPPLLIPVVPDDYTAKLRAALDQFLELLADTKAKLNLPEPERNEEIELPAEFAV